jgi:hypothetical protein
LRNYYEIEGDTVKIRLDCKNGFDFWTLIDLVDLDKVNSTIPGKIYASYHASVFNYYAVYYTRDEDNQIKIKLLHRLIMDFPEFPYGVSHFDKDDTLDNRKRNLKTLTVEERNQSARNRVDNKSGIRGISWHKRTKAWRIYLTDYDGTYKYFGEYKDLDVAKAKTTAIKEEIATKRELLKKGEFTCLINVIKNQMNY